MRSKIACTVEFLGDTDYPFVSLPSLEIRSFNRREKRDTYNVIGIMKGEIEPGRENAIPLCYDIERDL